MPGTPLDFPTLRLIGWPYAGLPEDPAWAEAFAAHPEAKPARVSEQHRSGYVVADGPEAALKAESLPEWQKPRFPSHERAAVGDWVLLEGKKIVALLPRHTSIKRGAAGEHYHQQVIAANVDTVFIVCGLDDDFNPRRIERYLMLVGGGGAEPVVVLTKADQTDYAPDAVETLAELAAQDITVCAVNAKDPASVASLHGWLGAGRTAVLVGSSGAGKSTLTNTLLGIDRMKTAAVRENDSRGRHTTTHRALIPLPSGRVPDRYAGHARVEADRRGRTGGKRLRRYRGAGRTVQVPRLFAPDRAGLHGARGDRGGRYRRRAFHQLSEAARRGRGSGGEAGGAAGAGQHQDRWTADGEAVG